jgi:hypothetical protein
LRVLFVRIQYGQRAARVIASINIAETLQRLVSAKILRHTPKPANTAMPTYLLGPSTRHTIQATCKVIHASYPRIIYVIELDSAAGDDPVFAKDNPHWVKGMTCLYVGSSSLTAEERFGQHLAGVNAASVVLNFGKKLRHDLMPDQKFVPRKLALTLERRLARKLRREGFAVSQH